MRRMITRFLIIALTGLVLTGCDTSVNEDVDIAAYSEKSGGARTLNGDVRVGEHAVVSSGDLKTINGRIEVSEGAKVNDCATVNGSVAIRREAKTGNIESVNGDLRLDEEVTVDGNIRLVNGGVVLKPGTVVKGDVGTVNGPIEIHGATIKGSVVNYHGGMTITDGTLVKGGLVVKESDSHQKVEPVIIIGPSTEIVGTLEFKRPVRLYVHDTASVGEIKGAKPIRFSGDLPDAG